MIKKLVSTALISASLLFAAGAGASDQNLSRLLGIDAVAMSDAELAQVEGKGHGAFPLGALLIDRANSKLFQTPAWIDTEKGGLHPAAGKAMVNAQANGLK